MDDAETTAALTRASRALSPARARLRDAYGTGEAETLRDLLSRLEASEIVRAEIATAASVLVERVRAETSPTLMESFLAEYGLSTQEGVGLMCLAEALLRTPDAETIDELIHDKIEASDWAAHLGKSSSPLVNASTWALMLTGRVLDDDPDKPAASVRALVRRVGEPVVRAAVGQAMRLMGRQFVLGETIESAMRAARGLEGKGYSYSYDMLGEAARTDADAQRYARSYAEAIAAVAARASGDLRDAPGISIKLSALHPRYEYSGRGQVMDALLPRARDLVRQAARAGVGLNIDAEEQDRLEVSLDLIDALMGDPDLSDWRGFGVVVQAYGRRAAPLIETLAEMSERHGRPIMVRLVKGAYWDTEIKRAQEQGVEIFPVFTRKAATDVSYLACSKMLLDRRDRVYPQFATHNAHSCAAVLAMAGNDTRGFEFQRLHGMGEALHHVLKEQAGARCRIYAPVGAHRDLLAYLVRRLLENGANSSFVNQIVDPSIPAETIARDPVAEIEALVAPDGAAAAHPGVTPPPDLFAPQRRNARGVDLQEPSDAVPFIAARDAWADAEWTAAPMLAESVASAGSDAEAVFSPAEPTRRIGVVRSAERQDVAAALDAAVDVAPRWNAIPVEARSAALERASDLYEAASGELTALLAREAGKTLSDAVAEIREAVDFLRYYAAEARRLEAERPGQGRGVFVCISPWNFPLAIFTGQIAAALAAGNAVVAKPAEQTPLIAARAVALLREGGVPAGALQLLPGAGGSVGASLVADPRIAGVCFTGSTVTAQAIHRALAAGAGPDAVLIAETGGINAMLVDSTALPEQAVRDVIVGAFQSAGQRCSATRMLYVQEDGRERLTEMLFGAMDALRVGDPWREDVDVSPVIDARAQADIQSYIDAAAVEGRLLKALERPDRGTYVGPAVVAVGGIADIPREVFGPVLHVASFKASEIDAVVDAVNARGYGLTFGLHTRIDDRVQQIIERLRVGNAYVNRNQIGAIVGSQPFGGEGLSGTGPKAGGPLYLARFRRPPAVENAPEAAMLTGPTAGRVAAESVADALATVDARNWAARPDRIAALRRAVSGLGGLARRALREAAAFDAAPKTLPGPTGESNRYALAPRAAVLCLGPGAEIASAQAVQALAAGCATVVVCDAAAPALRALVDAGAPIVALDGALSPDALGALERVALVAHAGPNDWARAARVALAARDGPIVPLETAIFAPERYWIERHVCVDTTAAGGDAALLAAVG